MNRIQAAAQVIISRQNDLGEKIGNNKVYYGEFRDVQSGKKKLSLAARLHMKYAELGFNRKDRLKIFSSLVCREIESVKDLTAAEAIVLINVWQNTEEFLNDCTQRVKERSVETSNCSDARGA